ncbi:MAG: hypothetical protein K9M17_02790 [Mariprofundaceae bacterium]|nr:hypothetical protein [Mariprofundaceae bacterium]
MGVEIIIAIILGLMAAGALWLYWWYQGQKSIGAFGGGGTATTPTPTTPLPPPPPLPPQGDDWAEDITGLTKIIGIWHGAGNVKNGEAVTYQLRIHGENLQTGAVVYPENAKVGLFADPDSHVRILSVNGHIVSNEHYSFNIAQTATLADGWLTVELEGRNDPPPLDGKLVAVFTGSGGSATKQFEIIAKDNP